MINTVYFSTTCLSNTRTFWLLNPALTNEIVKLVAAKMKSYWPVLSRLNPGVPLAVFGK